MMRVVENTSKEGRLSGAVVASKKNQFSPEKREGDLFENLFFSDRIR